MTSQSKEDLQKGLLGLLYSKDAGHDFRNARYFVQKARELKLSQSPNIPEKIRYEILAAINFEDSVEGGHEIPVDAAFCYSRSAKNALDYGLPVISFICAMRSLEIYREMRTGKDQRFRERDKMSVHKLGETILRAAVQLTPELIISLRGFEEKSAYSRFLTTAA